MKFNKRKRFIPKITGRLKKELMCEICNSYQFYSDEGNCYNCGNNILYNFDDYQK